MKHQWIFLILLIMGNYFLLAQDESDPCIQIMSKTTEKQFKKARDLQKSGKKSEAFDIYYEILEESPDCMEVNYYLAMGYYLPIKMSGFIIDDLQKKNVGKALEAFNRIYNICPHYKIYYNLYAAQLAYFTENFSEAVKFAKVLIDNPDLVEKTENIEEAELIYKKSKFYNTILSNPVPFDPKPVAGISTQDDEYLATLSPDGTCFYFTRRKEVADVQSYFSTSEKKDKEFFSVSMKQNGIFDNGKPLPYPFNQSTNEGSPAINLTNDMLIFARVTESKVNNQSYPNYDLFYSEYIGDEWTTPQSLGANINRSDSWESQPSLSSDGKMLFFASDRPGGYGGSDIWYSERNSDGTWRKPINLGPIINTKNNERSPFLHTDSKTLYFSSAGHEGLGGMDVFYSKLDENGNWQKPENIGYPINSENDEVDFFVNLNGETAYFSSNNMESKDWNIYQFELYEKARPRNMIIVKGKVDSDDGNIIDAIVEIRDTAANIIASTKVNEVSGKYAIATEINKEEPKNLIINVKKEGHSYDTKLITKDQLAEQVITKDAEVKKVEVGKTYDLHDIYFETNEYTLSNDSKYIIDLFVEFLHDNPTIKVEIQGHTDNVGDDKANLILSENRAMAVYDYAVSRKVDETRLRYKGYGESSPIAPNDTPSGRAKNRRTIFLIYEK